MPAMPCARALHILILVVGLVAAPVARAADVTVFAAASLGSVLEALRPVWASAGGGRLTISAAGSSTLARQIVHGAPADVFVSASRDWMDAVEAQDRLVPGTRFDLLTNRLVLAAPCHRAAPLALTPDALAAALGDGRLAISLVDAVPAGIYGKAALIHLDLWATASAHLAQSDNARTALALVAAGAVPLGLVYATDADADARVCTVAKIPPESHPEIVYPAAAIAGGNRTAADRFLAMLRSDAARAIFEEHGFRQRTGPGG